MPSAVSRLPGLQLAATLRNTAPRVILARRSQASNARTGQVPLGRPASSVIRGTATSAPSLFWSVFELGRWTVTSFALKRRWTTSMPTTSDRRKAVASAIRNMARSRRPATVPGTRRGVA